MASIVPPIYGVGFTFGVGLFAQSNNQLLTAPTIAAGDFQISKDGGAFANPATTPSASPASSGRVLVTISATEAQADEIFVRAIDAAGSEWHSNAWVIHTAARGFDDLPEATDVNDEVAAALATYDAATGGDITGAVGGLNDLDSADVIAALGTYGAATAGDVTGAVAGLNDLDSADVIAALGTYGAATAGDVTGAVGGLNDLDSADVIAALGTYGAATVGDVTGAVGGLNDLDSADVIAALGTYGAATGADVDASEASLQDALLAYVQLMVREDAGIATDRATELALINQNEGSGAGGYDNTAESQEAIITHGDSDWTGGGGPGGGASVDDIWNAILSNYPYVGSAGYTLNFLNQMIPASVINIQSVFEGGVLTLRTHSTWAIPLDNLPDLSGYTKFVLVIKLNTFQDDLRSQLLLRSDTGLITVGGQAAGSPSNGTLVVQPGSRAIVGTVAIGETGVAQPGTYQWWLRGLNAAGGGDVATGSCIIQHGGTRVIS